MWAIYSLLSAFFAAITSLLLKLGLKNTNSIIVLALNSLVIFLITWSTIFILGRQSQLTSIDRKSFLFVIFGGMSTGLSWLFYYRALQMGDLAKVISVDKTSLVIGILLAFLFLREAITLKTLIGSSLIMLGTLVLVFRST